MTWFVLLIACAPPDPPTPADTVDTGSDTVETPATPTPGGRSGVLVFGSASGQTWVADTEGEAILGFAGDAVTRLPLGGEPTRLVRDGTTVWVTLRSTGALAELEEEGGGLRWIREAEVGAEPYDVVATPDHLYVSLSQQREVVELDRVSLTPTRRFALEGEPRAMALAQDPWTEVPLLAVVLERTPTLAVIDLAAGGITRHTLPPARRSTEPGCDMQLTPQVAGEVVWEPVADRLWVTGMYVDTALPPEPAEPGAATVDPCNADLRGTVYGGGSARIGRFNPVVYLVDLLDDIRVPPLLLPRSGTWPTTLEYVGSANATQLWVGFEGEDRTVYAGANPTTRTPDRVDFLESNGSILAGPGAPTTMRVADRRFGRPWRGVSWSRLRRAVDAFGVITAAPTDGIDPLLHRGLSLFHMATNPAIGRGVACASCHREGRDDGLTWRSPDMDRQTPSLASPAAETAPFSWTGGVATIADEIHLATTVRMGGLGPDAGQLESLVAFITRARPVRLPQPTTEERALRARGAALFARPDVGCATCHSDANGAGEGTVPLFGLPALSIPPLRGVAATAPYLHDGSAATLHDVIERCRDGAMGDTSGLSEDDDRALEAWLRGFGEP